MAVARCGGVVAALGALPVAVRHVVAGLVQVGDAEEAGTQPGRGFGDGTVVGIGGGMVVAGVVTGASATIVWLDVAVLPISILTMLFAFV
jgi:hypothetical protein